MAGRPAIHIHTIHHTSGRGANPRDAHAKHQPVLACESPSLDCGPGADRGCPCSIYKLLNGNRGRQVRGVSFVAFPCRGQILRGRTLPHPAAPGKGLFGEEVQSPFKRSVVHTPPVNDVQSEQRVERVVPIVWLSHQQIDGTRDYTSASVTEYQDSHFLIVQGRSTHTHNGQRLISV